MPRWSVRVLYVGYIGNVGISRDRIEISEAVRAMETTFILARVLNVGYFSYVGICAGQNRNTESMRAMEMTFT